MISSFLQLLERRYKGKLDKEADEFIQFAVDGAKKLQAMITDLLIYSRVETLKKPPIATNCEQVLLDSLKNIKISIEDSGSIITYDPLPTLMSDDSQLVQVFQNLISNAIKFNATKLPRIHISAKIKDKEWLFSIKDNR